MKVKEIKKIPKKDIIIPDYIMRPLQDEKYEDITDLSTSIASIGMINEIDVRIKDGKYELMAGVRRFVATKEDEILAKIFEDVSDLMAMILSLVENLQRKDIDVNIRDAYIYKIWKKGKKEGEFKYIKDLACEIGMSKYNLGIIISAEETKEKTQSPVVKTATSWELERTKSLSDHLDIREKLLKKKKDGQLTVEGLERISKQIKSEIDEGTKKEVVVKALELADKEKSVNKYLESNCSKAALPSGESSESSTNTRKNLVKVDKIFTDVLKTYKESPQDIKEKLEKGEIDVKDAKDLNQFKTTEARAQVLREIKKIDERKGMIEKLYDEDKKMNLATRLKQQDDIEKKGETEEKTRFDKEYEEKLEKESTKDQDHDQEFIDRYERLVSYTVSTFQHFHPKRLMSVDGKRRVLDMTRNLYGLYYQVLVESGVIKEIRPDEYENDKNIKRLASGDIKIVRNQ